MATFTIDGESLVLKLSGVEKVEAFHGDIRVPLGVVSQIRAVTDPWPELRGIRAPGTGIPGVIAVGTRRGTRIKDFTVVHGRGPAVVVDLDGSEFDRLVVTAEDAEAVAAELQERIRSN